MLARLSPGDVIIAAKLDRLFRSARDALATVDRLKERGVSIVLADMGAEPVTENGVSKLFFSILASVAEFERWRIAERMQEGRVGKRTRGGHVAVIRPTASEWSAKAEQRALSGRAGGHRSRAHPAGRRDDVPGDLCAPRLRRPHVAEWQGCSTRPQVRRMMTPPAPLTDTGACPPIS
jgi:hypothetical protein